MDYVGTPVIAPFGTVYRYPIITIECKKCHNSIPLVKIGKITEDAYGFCKNCNAKYEIKKE